MASVSIWTSRREALILFGIANVDEVTWREMEKLEIWLDDKGITRVHKNNFSWNKFQIGYEVQEIDQVTNERKNMMKAFCEKYNLSKPTFYAGLIGEAE